MAIDTRIEPPAPETSREVVMPITGMTCASCVRRVEKALGKVPGVQEASVNLATERARVVFDTSVANPVALKAAIEKAGYGVRELPPEAPASVPVAAGSAAGPAPAEPFALELDQTP